MASWEEFSRLLEAKKLDPVGKEDADVDNDGDTDSSDSYLKKRRSAVGAAIAADRKKKVAEALDPVGKEDKDVDNDGDHDESDKYLLNRRRVRSKIIAPKEKLKTDRDMFNIPKSEQEAAKERLLAKTKAKRMKEEVEQVDEGLLGGLGIAAGLAAAPYLAKKFLKPKVDKAIDNAQKTNKIPLSTGGTQADLRKARGLNNSFEPEGEVVDEGLPAIAAGAALVGGAGYLINKAKQATSAKNRNDATIGKPTLQGAASAIRKRNEMLKQLQNQSFELEGDEISEAEVLAMKDGVPGSVKVKPKFSIPGTNIGVGPNVPVKGTFTTTTPEQKAKIKKGDTTIDRGLYKQSRVGAGPTSNERQRYNRELVRQGKHDAPRMRVNSYEPEGEQLDERSVRMSRMVDRYLGRDKRKAKERKDNVKSIRRNREAIATEIARLAHDGDLPASVVRKAEKVGVRADHFKGAAKTALKKEEVEHIEEKAVSRAQQRFFGMVRAAQKGEMDSPSAEVSKAASSMSKSDVKDFAKTKHDKLPEKKETKEELSLVDKILEEVLNEAPKHTISGGKSKAKKYKAVAKQAKLAAAVNKMMKDDSEQESAPEPKKTEKERKAKAKEESKEKGKTATERAARTTAAGRIRAAKIKRQTEREKEAARTERQKEREERADRLRKERKDEKQKTKSERDKEKQKELEVKSKEKVRSAEESEAKKKVAAQQKRKEDAKREMVSSIESGASSLEKSSQDDKISATGTKLVGNVGNIASTGLKVAGGAARYGIAALKKRKEAKKQEELKKKNDEERAKEKEPVKESLSNWREEFIFEVEGEDKKEKIIDITKKKNKIEINPNMGESAAWTKKEGKSEAGGLNEKGRKSYERENPGSDLKAPSKKVGNPRRASFCARMKGMKKKLTSKKTANDPDSRINKSLRAWNC